MHLPRQLTDEERESVFTAFEEYDERQAEIYEEHILLPGRASKERIDNQAGNDAEDTSRSEIPSPKDIPLFTPNESIPLLTSSSSSVNFMISDADTRGDFWGLYSKTIETGQSSKVYTTNAKTRYAFSSVKEPSADDLTLKVGISSSLPQHDDKYDC